MRSTAKGVSFSFWMDLLSSVGIRNLKMLPYLIRRILAAVSTLFFVLLLTFLFLRFAPGGPFDSDQITSPEIHAQILHHYQLDLPVWKQFLIWISRVVSGDFGESYQQLGTPVTQMISFALPLSMTLGISALVFAIFGGILGVFILKGLNSSVLNALFHFLSVMILSLPSFLIASLLIWIFSLKLNWLPAALDEGPQSWILPIITLAIRPLILVFTLLDASINTVLKEDYIRTAFGKGLSHFEVLSKHVLKNAIVPIIALLGPLTANLLTGSFLVETVFQLPGLGRCFIQSVMNRDYPLVMGVTLVYGIILVISQLGVDLILIWADPRVRTGQSL